MGKPTLTDMYILHLRGFAFGELLRGRGPFGPAGSVFLPFLAV